MTSIYANLWEQKNVFTEEKGGQLPQDWFGTPTWLSIYGLNTYMVAVTSYENALYPVPGEIALKSYPLFTTQQSYIGPCMNYVIGQNEICQGINPGCSLISFVSFSLILGPGDKGNWGLIISNQGHLPSVTQLCLGGRGGCWNPWGIFDGCDFCLHSILHVTWNLEYRQLLLDSSELQIFIIGDPSQDLSKGNLRWHYKGSHMFVPCTYMWNPRWLSDPDFLHAEFLWQK